MIISLGPDLEAAMNEQARRRNVTPEVLVLNVLRQHFLAPVALEPRDEWERGLLEAARDCGVSLPDWAVTSEGIYE
jgi:hypothetical protein